MSATNQRDKYMYMYLFSFYTCRELTPWYMYLPVPLNIFWSRIKDDSADTKINKYYLKYQQYMIYIVI